MWEWIAQNSQTIIAVVSVLIASCALWLTIKQQKANTRFNKLSTLPIVVTEFNAQPFKVELKNNGLGPALLKDIKLRVFDDIINLRGTPDVLVSMDFSKKVFNRTIKLSCQFSHIREEGHWLTPSETLKVVEIIVKEENNPYNILELVDITNNSVVTGEYQSIYGDKFDLRTNLPVK